MDGVYIEHNGIIVERDRPDVLGACMAALRPVGWSRVTLSGMDETQLAAARAAGGVIRVPKSQPAPFVDLSRPFLERLSPGTRYQLRRSARRYGERGALEVHRAADVAEALGMLDALARLHQITWTARGKPGAFAEPFFLRFHRALIAGAFARDEIDLLRIAAGCDVVGYLYNFRPAGRVLAYQSGFDYAAARPHEKPGLACHHLAIERAAAQGFSRYDFLAGDDQYKTSLASAAVTLHWAEWLSRWSPRGALARLSPRPG